ncbi:hypothetical protein ACWF94_14880 [Streptomyces sp. NPDC055078]
MSAVTPFLVVPAALWTLIAGAAVVVSSWLSVRARRSGAERALWHPFAAPFPAALLAAALGYVAAASTVGGLSLRAALFCSLWPAMAATALLYTAAAYSPRWPNVTGGAWAALGGALYGALPG